MLSKPTQSTFYSNPLVIGLGYFLLIWLLILPSGFNISTDMIGFWGSDQLDTISLHWAVWNPSAHFYPDGFNFWTLTPNILDHIAFWPFQQTLSFPLSINLWWIGVLWLNAMCAHWMIVQQSDRHDTAWLAGIICLVGEPILREINWGHAPHSMCFPIFLSLGYWWKWEQSKRHLHLMLSSFFGGLVGWIYLFYVPFLILIMVPKLLSCPWKFTSLWLGGICLMLLPNLYWVWHVSSDMTTIPNPPLIDGQTLVDLHSNNWLWWWNPSPIDITSQLSGITVFAVGWMVFQSKATRRQASFGLWSLFIGGLLLMGTTTPVFEMVQAIPFLDRLQWPERFGIVALTGSILLVGYLPRSLWLIPLVLVEMPLRSENVPLHTVSMKPYECYRSLEHTQGAILSLPIKSGPDLYNIHGVFQQMHQRDLVNPFILPPFISPPQSWEQQRREHWMLQIDGEEAISTLSASELYAKGITSIIVDRNWVPDERQVQIIERLSPVLGEPQNLGCIYHWSTNDNQIDLDEVSIDHKPILPKVHSIQVPLQ